jgi:hypothetical protein
LEENNQIIITICRLFLCNKLKIEDLRKGIWLINYK